MCIKILEVLKDKMFLNFILKNQWIGAGEKLENQSEM